MKVTECTARTLQQKQAIEELDGSIEDVDLVMANAEKALNSIGVTIRGSGGDLRAIEDILGDVAGKWDTLSDSTRGYVSAMLAGTNRRSYFETLMNNYSRVEELVQASESSFGQMAEANEVRVESLDGQVGKLKVSMGELYTTVMSDETIKGAIKTLDKFVQKVTDLASFIKNNFIPIGITLLGLWGSIEMALFKNTKSSGLLHTVFGMFEKGGIFGKGGKIGNVISTLTSTFGKMGTVALGVGIPAVVALGTSIIREMKRATPSVETMKEKMGEVTSSIESYKTAQSNLDALNVDVSGMETMIEKINESKEGSEEQKVLLEEVNTLLQQHGSNYESLKGVIDDENLSLETRLALLKQEAELEANRTKQKMRSNLFDIDVDEGSFWQGVGKNMGIGSTAPEKMVKTVKNEVDSLIETYHQLSLAQKTAQNAEERGQQPRSVTINQIKELSEKLTSQQLKVQECVLENEKYQSQLDSLLQDGTISQSEYDELIQNHANAMAELQRVTDETDLTLDVKIGSGETEEKGFGDVGEVDFANIDLITDKADVATNDIREKFEILQETLNSLDTQSQMYAVEDFVESLEGIEMSSEEASDYLKLLKKTFKDLPDDIETVEEALEHLKDSLDFSDESTESMKDLNASYLETAEQIESIQSLLDSLSDGVDVSELRTLFDADVMSDYNGALTDTIAIQEHLNNKMSEMQERHNEAYRNMILDDENFWNSKIANSEAWANHEASIQSQITQMGAEMLGIQETDFINFINNKGGYREVDLSNAETFAQAEGLTSASILNQMLGFYDQYTNEKGGARNTDMQNIYAFLNEQGGAEARTIQQLVQMWNAYYQAKKATISAEIDKMAGAYDDLGNVSPELMSQLHSLQRMNNSMQNFFGSVKTSFGGVGGGGANQRGHTTNKIGGGGSGGGSRKPSTASKGSGSKGSGGSKSPSSSSSSSSSKATEKEIEDLDLEIDKFQELEEAINRVSEALERNSYAQQMVGTKAELKGLLTEEIALMEKKQKAIGDLQAEIRKEQQALKEWGHRANLKFDGDELVGDLVTGGSIADRLKDAQDWANSASGAEKEWRKNDTLQVQENIERYYELMNKLGDVTNQYNEMTIAIRDAKKEQEKLLKEVENMADRYLKFAMKEKALDNELSLNRRKQEYAVGIELIQLRERELEILKQQRDVNSGKIDELKKEKNELADLIQKSGFTIGTDGTITNYDEIWKKKTDEYNKLAGLDAEDYKEKLDELEENIDRYLELVNDELPQAEEYYYDIADALKEIEEQQKEWAEQLEEVMDKLDRLYDVTKKLSKAENELALIEAKLNTATGDEKIALLKRQEEIYQAQKNLMLEQLNIQKQIAEEKRMELSNLGVAFDKDSYVSNYEDLVKKMQKQIESMPGGEARDKAIEELEELIEKIEEYDSLVRDEIPSTEQTWWDLTASIKEAQREQLQIVQDVQQSIANAIKNKWQESTSALSEEIDKQKELLNKQWSDEDWEDSLGKAEMELNKLQAQIDNLSKDTSLQGQLKLEQLKEQYKEQMEALNQMIKDHERENANQMFEDEKNKLDEEMNDLLTPEKLAEMVNQALSTGMVQIGEETLTLNELMLDNIMQQEDAYYALGEVMKSEMLDSLEQAKKLYLDISKLTNSILVDTSSFSIGNMSRSLGNLKLSKGSQILNNNHSPLVAITMQGAMDNAITLDDVKKVANEQCDNLMVKLNELLK